MASIIKAGNKWRVQIKVGNDRRSNTFNNEEDARSWGAATEGKLRARVEAEELLSAGVKPKYFPMRVFQALMDAPLSATEIINAAAPKSAFCGVYFLIKDDRIIYVGQSKNAMRRVTRHIDEGREFDRFTVVSCPEEDLDRLERTFITALVPEENMTFGNAG